MTALSKAYLVHYLLLVLNPQGDKKYMFTIEPVTQTQIDKLSAALSSPGNNVSIAKTGPNNYEVTGHGVTAEAVYDAQDTGGTLTVTVKHKPFIVPESAIENGIKEALSKLT